MCGSGDAMENKMKLSLKTVGELSASELYEILRLREAVFIVEQNCPYPEADGKDPGAVHLYYADEGGTVQAYLRLYPKVGEAGTVQIGRVVTSSSARGTGLGRRILNKGIEYAKEKMGAHKLYLEAQVYAIGFYEKEGFEVTSGEFLEDGIPHVEMRRQC